MKLLLCVHPHEEHLVGDVLKVSDLQAEQLLGKKAGNYDVWKVQKDLGRGPLDPNPEAMAAAQAAFEAQQAEVLRKQQEAEAEAERQRQEAEDKAKAEAEAERQRQEAAAEAAAQAEKSKGKGKAKEADAADAQAQ